ncbi:MAG: manganese efflux pump [Eubacterium sp.]|nr:manganese efflux pump [Eubacterium sp.]
MDAFSVSLADGMRDPGMGSRGMLRIAGCFAGFQFLMPVIGYICVHTVVELLPAFLSVLPWVALLLLGFIGIKMLIEGTKTTKTDLRIKKDVSLQASDYSPLSDEKTVDATEGLGGRLLLQGVATSIDALSVGFTIAEYSYIEAFLSALMIGAVTFFICIAGIIIGRQIGIRIGNYAQILGGVILIGIGILGVVF